MARLFEVIAELFLNTLNRRGRTTQLLRGAGKLESNLGQKDGFFAEIVDPEECEQP